MLYYFRGLWLAHDYDGAIRVWLNGHEVYASPNTPAHAEYPGYFDQLATAEHHAAGSGTDEPSCSQVEITAFHQYLTVGTNILAIANWDYDPTGTELVAGVQLRLEPGEAPTAIKLASFDATIHDGRVLLQWRTGLEVDNLGFHLYREANGVRTRITPEIVAGSALLGGPVRYVDFRARRVLGGSAAVGTATDSGRPLGVEDSRSGRGMVSRGAGGDCCGRTGSRFRSAFPAALRRGPA